MMATCEMDVLKRGAILPEAHKAVSVFHWFIQIMHRIFMCVCVCVCVCVYIKLFICMCMGMCQYCVSTVACRFWVTAFFNERNLTPAALTFARTLCDLFLVVSLFMS